nr:anaphase-promoting complex subunit 2 [Cryptococcus depauperatus CBS 7841]
MALTAALSIWGSSDAEDYAHNPIALETARRYLQPRDIDDPASLKASLTTSVVNAFGIIKERGLAKTAFDDFLDSVEENFGVVKGDIDTCLGQLEQGGFDQDENKKIIQILVHLFDRLASWQRTWGIPLRAFQDNSYITRYTKTFHHLLHASFPPTFPSTLHRFFYASLLLLPPYTNQHSNARIRGQISVNADRPLTPPPSPHLTRLGIFPRYSGSLSRVAHEAIKKIALEEAEQGWEERKLWRARERIGEGVACWLAGMFEGNDTVQGALRPMYSRFDYYLCKCFFDIRTKELFDIIVDFPDSLAALEDLRECLFKIDHRLVLISRLTVANDNRLLHPGANTSIILHLYISTIRSLRILDPPGVLLHSVAGPIRDCLRKRGDTVRCIVEMLASGKLLDENDEGLIGEGNEAAEDFTDPRWEPEPTDAAPEFRSGKPSDIVSTLVSIYGSKQVIITELERYLAERLLQVKGYDATEEIMTIESLKLKFGDLAMAGCDVMVKDVADSKRIDGHVQGDVTSVMHPLVISKMFWPDMPKTTLKLPSKLQKVHEEYESAFHRFKPDKHLRFVPNLGTISLTVNLSDRSVTAEASPVQASIIMLFEDEHHTWNINDLSCELGLDKLELTKGLRWWALQGVLKDEGNGIWMLLEVAEEYRYDQA